MNRDPDVIIAGAGPAGAVAAAAMAQRGMRVVLCDRAAFPRDKTCGDALIADSLGALDRIGLRARVEERARACSSLEVVTANGTATNLPGAIAVLPRRDLDAMLVAHAAACGADFQRIAVDAPLVENGSVVGVRGRTPAGAAVTLHAPLTVLATGANGAALRAFDPDARTEASGTALRAYAAPAAGRAAGSACVIALDRTLTPGYAWAFPSPGGTMNVGVGLFRGEGLRAAGINLRASLQALLDGRGPIGERFGPFTGATPVTGAPLRTSLTGSSSTRRGLAVIGEAAGTTYAATGEGIGKAMESALLLDELAADGDDIPGTGVVYGDLLRARYGGRFRAYAIAERWVSFPRFVDYVARRANDSPYIKRRLAEFLSESELPSRVFSLRGLWRLTTAR
ncbi:MAG: NAD(P)/FAD-dependent oxidoreductase [Acidobacteriota bacterium]|nr:NAD(P)/FAD-dependent oxidoreductase [Acidobacteriota bacterium]